MHNTFGIETEVAFRRAEWQRAVTADALASRAARTRKARLFQLPRVSFARLRPLAAAWLPFSSLVRPHETGVIPCPADC
jgi:hypothetical protein